MSEIYDWVMEVVDPSSGVVVLATGIGVTTALISVVQAVLLNPLPWPDAHRLVIIHAVELSERSNPASATSWNRAPISWFAWRDLQACEAFESVGAWMPTEQIIGDERSEFVSVYYTSSSFFQVLGVRPFAGRLFGPDEDEGMVSSAVISHETWLSRFGGKPDIVGSTVSLAHTLRSSTERKLIVGVLPPGFTFQGQRPEVMLPLGLMSFNGSFEQNRFLRAVGRLASGVSLQQATALAEPLVRGAEAPDHRSVRLVHLLEDQFGSVAMPLWLLAATATLLLAIACSCVAGLLLADGAERRLEIAIRVSLGAMRGQLFTQLLAEHLSIALVAGLLGALLAGLASPILFKSGPVAIRGLEAVGFDSMILAWALGMSALTVLVFGVGPAASLSKTPAGSTTSFGKPTAHRWTVVGQLALTHVIAMSAAIYGGVLLHVQSEPLGFPVEGLVVARVRPTSGPTVTLDDRAPLASASGIIAYDWLHTNRMIEALRSAPGVIDAAGVSVAPFTIITPTTTVVDENTGTEYLVRRREVTETFFRTLGIPVVSGRPFSASDRAAGLPTSTVISKEFARRLGGQNIVGRRLRWGGTPLEIIGVVGDVHDLRFREELPSVYLPNFRLEHINYLVARIAGESASFLPTMQRTLEAQDPFIKVTMTAAMPDLVSQSRADEQFSAFLSVAFALAALGLAGLGFFSVTTYVIGCRRHDTAVRIALGATAKDIRRLLSRELTLILMFGTMLGLPLAYGASVVIASSTAGASTSPWLFAGVVAALWLGAGAAAVIPMRQASRIDVLSALQE